MWHGWDARIRKGLALIFIAAVIVEIRVSHVVGRWQEPREHLGRIGLVIGLGLILIGFSVAALSGGRPTANSEGKSPHAGR